MAAQRAALRDDDDNEERELLLDDLEGAGYLRARLPGISIFDKVLGGLCWAISASGDQVDVDLAFDETLDVGQRIKLAENVVEALRAMGCPHELQAHQIHGHDLAALRPIVRWLRKRVESSQSARGKRLQLAARLQHRTQSARTLLSSPTGSLSSVGSRKSLSLQAVPTVDKLPRRASQPRTSLVALSADDFDRQLRPVRRFQIDERQPVQQGLDPCDVEQAWVRAVLLEFGERVPAAPVPGSPSFSPASGLRTPSSPPQGFEASLAAETRRAQAEAAQEQERARAREEKLLERAAPPRPLRKAAHLSDTDLEALEARVRELGERRSIAEEARNEACASHERARDQLAEAQTKAKAAHQCKRELSKRLKSEATSREDLERLTALVGELRIIGQDAQSAAAASTARTHDLEEAIAAAKSKNAADQTTAGGQAAQIGENIARLTQRRDNLAHEAASCAAELERLSRKVDDVPVRAELIQYERRMFELYEELANKFEENRRHVSTYNTLKVIHELVEKDCSLLFSVNETFRASMMDSARAKGQFIEEFRGVVKGLEIKREQMQGQLDAKLSAQAESERAHHEVVRRQREYAQAVKLFQLECERQRDLAARQVKN